MAEQTHISWADDTFNPWVGCMKVGPACDGCYAEHLMDTRLGRVEFGGPGKGVGTRARTAPANWRKPIIWNREQEAYEHNCRLIGEVAEPRFVFCASLADVFDNAVPMEWRQDLFQLIRRTPHLTWLLLTKRPQNITRLFEACTLVCSGETLADRWPRNAAIGCTVVTQEEADRDVPHLLAAKSVLKPAFAFLSMEPLLGPVDLTHLQGPHSILNGFTGTETDELGKCGWEGGVDWVITGGETDQGAHKARPADPDWYRGLRDQCAAAGIPFHHKQNGEWCEFGERGQTAASNMNFLGKPDDGPDGWTRYGEGDSCRIVTRIGKARAGRLLDGVIHDARPGVA